MARVDPRASWRRCWRRAAAFGLAVGTAACCGPDDELAGTPDAAPALAPQDPPACAATPSTTPGFCDLTARAGVDVVRRSPGVMYQAGGVALFDADGDGDLDLYATGLLDGGRLYLNDGAAHFTDGTAAAGLDGVGDGVGVAAADLDDDGDQDLVVTGLNERVRLYENDGAGRFAEIGVAAGLGADERITTSAVAADIDADGDLDLFVGNLLRPNLDPRTAGVLLSLPSLLYRNDGGLRFVDVAATFGLDDGDGVTTAAAFADLDGDARLDLYVANDFGPLSRTSPNRDLRGAAGGGFVPAAAAAPARSMFAKSVAPADYDGDGDVDLFLSNFGANVLLRNDGAGGFEDVAAAAGLAAPGYVDPSEPLAAPVRYDAQSAVEDDRGLALWQAQYVADMAGQHLKTSWGALWLDFDHDGRLDLYVVNGYWGGGFDIAPEGRRQPNLLYRGRDDGGFEALPQIGAGDRGDGRGAAAGDLDGDGDLDLVIANHGYNFDAQGGRLVILRNDAAAGGHVRVHLVGTVSNRDAVGARVELEAGGRTQLRWVSGGDGLLSSSQRDPHFGVPAGVTPARLRVVWPSGLVSERVAPPLGATTTVVEGEP